MRRIAIVLVAVLGCSVERAAPGPAEGAHPEGWGVKDDPSHHAKWLALNGYPVASRCGQCHGDDFAGGAVGVSCSGSNCHKDSPSSCDTCHGAQGSPRPATGAHAAHQAYCDTCHEIPTRTAIEIERHASAGAQRRRETSTDHAALVRFSGLARHGGREPTWNRDTKRCDNAYCHADKASPPWNDTARIQCDGCHRAPPSDHARWARVASTPESCATCHPPRGDARHVNGGVELTSPECTTCHGSGTRPSPPVALDGSTDPTSRGVGAHERHLNPNLPDRISRAVACTACHVVPASVTASGHIDGTQPTVRLASGGTYESTSATCNVWCHFDRAPGPRWTDATGAARRCDGCHDNPPLKTRAGTPHPNVAGDVEVCRACHVYDAATHVNGVVEYRTP